VRPLSSQILHHLGSKEPKWPYTCFAQAPCSQYNPILGPYGYRERDLLIMPNLLPTYGPFVLEHAPSREYSIGHKPHKPFWVCPSQDKILNLPA